MKRVAFLFTILLGFLSTPYAQNSSLTKLFDTYSEDREFTYVYTGNGINTVSLFPKAANDKLKDPANDIRFVKILTSEEKEESKSVTSFTHSIKKILKSEGFELLLKVRDEDDKVEIYQKKFDAAMNDMIILVEDSDSVAAIWVFGKFDGNSIIKSYY